MAAAVGLPAAGAAGSEEAEDTAEATGAGAAGLRRTDSGRKRRCRVAAGG